MKYIFKKIYYKFYQTIFFSNSKKRVIESAKYLYDKKDNRKSILIWTTQKTASTFINKAIGSIAKNSGYKYFDYSSYIWYLGNKIKLKNPYQIESDCPFLYREYGEIYGPIRKPIDIKNLNKYKNIFFLRDPRDLLVSSFYSKSYSHEVPQNKFERQEFLEERKSILKKGIDNFCLEYADKWIIPYFEKYKEIKNNSVENHFLIYENFINSPGDFIKELSEVMNIQVSENLVKKLTRDALSPFANKKYQIFNKRKITHYRSGKNRQFETELKEETLFKLNTKLNKILKYWGFPI